MIRGRRSPRGVRLAHLATYPGCWVTQVGIPAFTAARAARGGSRRVALFASVSMLGTSAIFHTIKHFTGRERPHPEFHLVGTNDSSFPSGHAATSAAAARVLAELTGAPKMPLALAAGVVGITRVYLGVHHPSDVLAGFAIGWCWTSAMSRLVDPHEPTASEEAGISGFTAEVVFPGNAGETSARAAEQQAVDDGHPCIP